MLSFWHLYRPTRKSDLSDSSVLGDMKIRLSVRTLPTLVKSYAPLTLTLPDFHAGVKVLFLITNIKMVSKPSTSAFEGVKMLK